MKLSWSEEDEAFRAELRQFLDAHAPPEARRRNRDYDLGDALPEWGRHWQATLFDNGWMIPAYPPELGGRNATPVQTLLYLEELNRQQIIRSLHFGGYAIVGPSLLEFGSEQQRELAAPSIRGDIVWCVGMSEPNAGSDLAGLQTRAVDDGDTFVVSGQKVWTSYAMIADRCFCYVRTDRDAPKHKGISVLMIDMDTPGIDVRPLRHISGKADFAEVFFDEVVVPKENLIGDLNGGWRITMGSLAHERGALWVEGVAASQQLVEELIELARDRGVAADAGVRRRLAAAYERTQSLRALGYKGFAGFAQGSSAPEHSYMKLATSEFRKELTQLGLDLEGPFGVVTGGEWGADPARWVNRHFIALAGTIGGGTSEIQRNVIASRVLGLPKG
ncbi:MAG: putative acyl-CoA dehydrogenase FadE17 [Acidimicrobiales bacterium]|nr:putative acyl-CoA dehydrogenase FadE17 [Acidimicrobiales bacterium]